MTTPSHETWQDDRQREPRTIKEALRMDTEPSDDEARDQERKDEQYLDESRGLWGPTE